jgi:hypothetical protein
VREIARGMGILPDEPTVIRGDNQSSVRVSNDPKAAGRLRHAQRRFATCQARVARGDVIIVHVSDANNAADFLTKWITMAKLNASIAYTSNAQAKPDYVNAPHPAPALEASMADFDPDYSETESDVITEEGDYADAGWVTGNGPSMCMFDYFDDFVAYYRIYGTSFELWYAWNAAQSFSLEEFEEVAPDENNDDVE